ncbi:MAG: four helix bundle protein [Gemmatimonadaceae bacterium]|nr:four helix bundle protein [Gemmatimonadaceae bacterium]
MQPFEQLLVWQKAHAVAVALFHASTPWREFELRAQLRRCAASVPANIAEGAGTDSPGLFARYLSHAQASASELRYHLRYAHDVGMIDATEFSGYDTRVQEVRRMLHALTLRIRQRAKP